MNSKVAQEIKIKYNKLVRAMGAQIFIHYDGNLMEVLIQTLVKRQNDQVGILAHSPDLPDDARVQLLGIP